MDENLKKVEIELEAEKIFGTKSGLNSKALEVEGVKLWICPQSLALDSPVFHAMFYGDFADGKEEVVPLPEKTLEEFLPFLKCLTRQPGYVEIMGRQKAHIS